VWLGGDEGGAWQAAWLRDCYFATDDSDFRREFETSIFT